MQIAIALVGALGLICLVLFLLMIFFSKVDDDLEGVAATLLIVGIIATIALYVLALVK